MSQDRTGPIVHVRENSDTELEALFNIAMNPSLSETHNKTVPLRMRNLPASFFRPPEPPKQMQQPLGVSKDNTIDAPGYHGAVNSSSMNIAHTRAHSSPASLQQSLSAAPPPPPTSHVRQHSYDALDEQPLPAGWDMAKTPQGQRYYLNHVLQITTWNDPRKTHSTNPATISSSNNNNNNTTTSNLNSLPQTGSPAPSTQPTLTAPINVDKVPLPPGWERAYTAECEVYFINHIERTTSWFHPSIPVHLQRPGMKFQSQNATSGSNLLTSQQDQLKQLKLQQLQMEQEALKKRQDEIARQEMALRAQVGESVLGTPGDITSLSQSSELTTDPFFGQTGTSDHHSRQESADSGLGGMGTSYSLPRTPDDFLGNMEDMDTQDGGPKLSGQSDFGSMDMGGVSDVGDHLNMDSDDLVPSLQEEISSELLKDVEKVLGNKDHPLTWL
ncbi:transcriptional coactivator YAP1-like [Biomphalaria glabrata]|uniref:Transcriptional coactivator YAP1-like n=1 Tax=Biomphalaria glabrata TaxID=6526 RepID=A0A2C9JV78_BIOGL|nr:transcriptional coactivator YAP1-like [Biomphalaria glabrata]KAI8772269.1 transcriptional coactivator YAP1 [Biomphalaria glabrata]